MSFISQNFGYDEAYKNPMVKLYGKGPGGKKCRDCKHLYVKEWDKRYYKCALRINTNGPGTDHRANWHACGKFVEKG